MYWRPGCNCWCPGCVLDPWLYIGAMVVYYSPAYVGAYWLYIGALDVDYSFVSKLEPRQLTAALVVYWSCAWLCIEALAVSLSPGCFL